ncbi:MAG: GMC oxidoreductase [Pseudomonadota bacterium]
MWWGRALYPHDASDAAPEVDIRARSHTFYHRVATCRMGTDPDAVTDRHGRVNGVKGLRVVNALLMQRLTVGFGVRRSGDWGRGPGSSPGRVMLCVSPARGW